MKRHLNRMSVLITALMFTGLSLGLLPALQAQPAESDLRNPSVLAQRIASAPASFRLIDVRTPGEFAQGHIPTAENIDYRRIATRMVEGDRDALIVVYCRSGNRSARAARTLASLGYTNVVDFGGIIRWNGPVERS